MSARRTAVGLGVSAAVHALALAAVVLAAHGVVRSSTTPAPALAAAGPLFRVEMRSLGGGAAAPPEGATPTARPAGSALPTESATTALPARSDSSAQLERTGAPAHPERSRGADSLQPSADSARTEETGPAGLADERVAPDSAGLPNGARAAGEPGAPTTGAGSGTTASGPGGPNGSAGPASGPATSGTGAGAAADDVVQAVHARLAAAAGACAPAAARRFGLEGTVGLHFCVEAGGAPTPAAIHVGSGQALLDDAAVTCVVPRAAPFPDGARGRCFEVPVRFAAVR